MAIDIVPVSQLPEFQRPPSPESTHVVNIRPSEIDGTEPFIVSFGPQHPSTHGVFRLEAVLDGEKVLSVKPFVQYMHRNMEKHCENKEYYQIVPYFDRLDYCASMTQEMTYVMGVEQLLDWPVPARAEYIRVIMCELNRIASHALSYGTFGMDVGAMTPIFYCFQAREKILDLFEAASGARLLYNYFVVGGITRDLPSGWVQKCKDLCTDLETNFLPQHEQFLIRNSIYYARTMHIGIITPEMAERHGITGPKLRGSGMKWDLRRNYPYDPERQGTYSVYKDLEFDIPTGNSCDGQGQLGSCWDRMMVRFKEMKESVKIVRQALDKLPHGGVQNLPMPRKLTPNGQVYCATEAARGELGMRIIADGTDKPYRLHVNSPGFNVIYALPELCRDILVADLIAVVGSVDFVMGEVGR